MFNSVFSRPEVVKGCQQRKPKAQAALYDHYKGRLMGLCQRYARTTAEAEDIFQEAFLKIFSQIHQLKNPESLDSWVGAVVIRTAINYYHANKRQQQQESIGEDTTDLTDDLDILALLSLEEITRLIQHLPDRCRMVVNLYLIDGYEHREIAELISITVGTSKSQLARGKALLRNMLLKLGVLRYGQ